MPRVVTTPTIERQPSLSQGGILFTPTATPPQSPPQLQPQSAPAIAPDLEAALRNVLQGLQLSRASTLALMRMQLAVRSGERLQAMEAMDRLDTLDTELERVLARAPSPGAQDAAWQAVAKHIEDQKLALAFEKLALASGIVGPGMVSVDDTLPAAPGEPGHTADPAAWEPTEPLPDMPELAALRPSQDAQEDYYAAEYFAPERARGSRSSTIIGLILTLLIAAGIAAAVWFYL